ncbi:MAG: hypothetical protein AAGD22_14875 [Verrucomicrobiota bacterium]
MFLRTAQFLTLALFLGVTTAPVAPGLAFCTIADSFDCPASQSPESCDSGQSLPHSCCPSPASLAKKDCCIEIPAPLNQYTAPLSHELKGPALADTLHLPAAFLSTPVWSPTKPIAAKSLTVPPPRNLADQLALRQSLLL